MSGPRPPKNFNINAKTVVAPAAAFCMAIILFVYSRTSIQAAKRNAQKHREADGGQINWNNESLRRHGRLEAPVDQGVVKGIVETLQEGKMKQAGKEEGKKGVVESKAERRIRELRRSG